MLKEESIKCWFFVDSTLNAERQYRTFFFKLEHIRYNHANLAMPVCGKGTSTGVSCQDNQDKDNIAEHNLFHISPSLHPSSSDVDKDQAAIVIDGDHGILDVPTEQLLLQELMPALEQDNYAKQTNHCFIEKLVVTANFDRETS